MKRFFISLIVLGVGLAGVWTGNVWCQSSSISLQKKVLTSYSENEITISIDFPVPIITKVKIQGVGEFDRVNIEGTHRMGKTGEPVLPVEGLNILLPYNKDVSEIKVSYPEEVVLEGTYTIEPAQKPYPLSSMRWLSKSTLPKNNIYNKDTYIPTQLFSEKSIQRYRGYSILPLNLYPVRYIPKLGKLYLYPQITIKIKLLKPKLPMKSQLYRGLPEDEELIKKKVINPEVIESYPKPSKSLLLQENYKYVIITNQYLKEVSASYTFKDLIDYKKAKGITATITTTEWIYENFNGADSQEKIRNFIRFAHENWTTGYVLLGGDTNIVPYRGLYAEVGATTDKNIPADLYYACMDGPFNFDGDDKWGEPNDGENGGDVDLRAEVYVGRAPVDTPNEMSNFVKKTLDYEESKEEQSPYLNLAYMVGEFLSVSGGGGCLAKAVLINQSSKEGILSSLRRLRDMLTSSEKGREYVKFYYQHSSELGLIILKTPSLWSFCIDILKKSTPLIQDAVEGELKDFPEEMLLEIRSTVNNIKEKAGPELLKTIEQIEEELLSDKQKIPSFVNSLTPKESDELEIEPLDDSTWGGDYKDEIKNGTNTNGFTTAGFASSPFFEVNTLYERDTNPKWSKEDLIAIINEGVHAINHMGHANESSCMKMRNTDVDNLVNTDFFLGYSQGCYAGAFDRNNPDCVLERFITSAHGAFAFIGNSRSGWYKKNSTNGPSQYYDRQFWDAIFGEEILNIGIAHQDSKEDNINFLDEEDAMRWCYYSLNLFGDPQTSFFIGSHQPTELEILALSPIVAIKGKDFSTKLRARGGKFPYSWEIVAGGLPPGLSFNSEEGIISGKPIQKKKTLFKIRVKDASTPQQFKEKELMVKVVDIDEDFETGNLNKWPWQTDGDTKWYVYYYSDKNDYIARAGNIGNNQNSWLEITLGGLSHIAFSYSVSSEERKDFLNFYIDNTLKGQWSGEAGGIAIFKVEAGTHTFRWIYSKDETGKDNNDTAVIDDVCFVTESSIPRPQRPFFSQRDQRWAKNPIVDESGIVCGTIGDEGNNPIGCAMTSVAMVLKYYGVDTDPEQLNAWLNKNKGYASGGYLYWNKPGTYSKEVHSKKIQYRDGLSWSSQNPAQDNDHWTELNNLLEKGYSVIVEVDGYPQTPGLQSHWVLITFFEGGAIDDPENYYINDPYDEPSKFNPKTTLSRYYNKTSTNTFFAIRVYDGIKFDKDNMVQTIANGEVRTDADVNSPEIVDFDYPDYVPGGVRGKVLDGPIGKDNFIWWKVDFGPGSYEGWIPQDWLEKIKTISSVQGGEVSLFDGTKILVSPDALSNDADVIVAEANLNTLAIVEANKKAETDPNLEVISTINTCRLFTALNANANNPITKLNGTATIIIPYSDVDNDGIVDDTQIDERWLRIFLLNEEEQKWEIISTSYADITSNIVWAQVNHLSTFSILKQTPGTISGIAKNTYDNSTISGVLIEAMPIGLATVVGSTTTDANGEYIIKLPAGTYTLRASKEGYNTQIKENIVVNAGKTISIEVVLLPLVSPNLTNIRLYPNPFKPYDGNPDTGIPYDGSANSGIIFDNLTQDCTVKIFNIVGELVRELSGTGKVQWDAKNSSGKEVASGIYIYLITDKAGRKATGKLAILR